MQELEVYNLEVQAYNGASALLPFAQESQDLEYTLGDGFAYQQQLSSFVTTFEQWTKASLAFDEAFSVYTQQEIQFYGYKC